jgi:hypothetical protein
MDPRTGKRLPSFDLKELQQDLSDSDNEAAPDLSDTQRRPSLTATTNEFPPMARMPSKEALIGALTDACA